MKRAEAPPAPAFDLENQTELHEKEMQEACGVVAFISFAEDAKQLCYMGLQTVQNRGEDGAGMAVSDGQNITAVHGEGQVTSALNNGQSLLGLAEAKLALGQVHYGTDLNAASQPFVNNNALGHNGQLTNARALAKRYEIDDTNASDSEVMAKSIDKQTEELGSTEAALEEVLPRVSGSFSAVVMEKDRIIAFRDRRGFRPLSIGMLADGGYAVASETAVFDVLGAELIGPVEPGTYVVITRDGIASHRWTEARPSTCGLEYAYFGRADSEIDGIEVAGARKRMGEHLAEDYPVDADVVIPMPDSGRQAADGYSKVSGIQAENGFYKNHLIGKTYILATQALRKAALALKHNPIRSVVEHKKLVVVDDSIVRGATMQDKNEKLRNKGAKEVNLRITFPPIKYPCFYGMNMKREDGLIAAEMTKEEIVKELGVDSLEYNTPERFAEAVGRPLGKLCMACATGEYPEEVPGQEFTQTQTTAA